MADDGYNPKLSIEERHALLIKERDYLKSRLREMTAAYEIARELPPADLNAALVRLAQHFHEPVMPISRYCDALKKWSEFACAQKIITRESQLSLEIGITKSNFLNRVLYGDEEVRTEKCPLHQGEWKGLEHPDSPCPHGCGLTGWLPAKK